MYRLIFPLILHLALLSNAIKVDVSLDAPSRAVTLSPSLLSFSLEQDRWIDWAGTTAKNTFFYNTLQNLRDKTGQPPWIRIGADSEDHSDFSDSVKYSETIFPPYSNNVPYPEATNITVGDGFYQIVSHLPAGTHVIWGVNLREENLTAAFLETRSIIKAFESPAVKAAGITLDFLEIGNEADLYPGHGARQLSWGLDQYVQQWTTFASNVSAAAGLSASSGTKFIGGAFAMSSHDDDGFSPQGIFKAGILNSYPGSLIQTISQHHYSGSFCRGSGGLLQDLMTKSTIRANLSAFGPDISITHEKGLDYILGETNSYSCHGAPGVSNTAGAALWALDYALYASQLGISRVFFHEGIGYKYNMIQPVELDRSTVDGSPLPAPLAPHVQPAYYGAIIIAEAIGTSGSTRAVELDIDNESIAGYAFYEGDVLVRALFINSQAYLKSADEQRGTIHIDLQLAGNGAGPSFMSLKRLSISYADDISGLTWGGQSYETSDARPDGDVSTETVLVTAGVDIRDTEAVLVTFMRKHNKRFHLRI